MQALSRTSIGWGWSGMVYLNAVTTVLRKYATGLVRVPVMRGGMGYFRKQRMYIRVCALCAHVCDSVRVCTCLGACALAAGMYFTEFTFVFKRSIAIVQTCTTNVKEYLCNSARISPNHCEKC